MCCGQALAEGPGAVLLDVGSWRGTDDCELQRCDAP